MSFDSELWEGISNNELSYKLLEFKDNGKHRLFSINIASGLAKEKILRFNNDAIKCNASECHITLVDKKRHETTRLLLVPRLEDSLHVIESYLDEASSPILSYSYQLKKQKINCS